MNIHMEKIHMEKIHIALLLSFFLDQERPQCGRNYVLFTFFPLFL